MRQLAHVHDALSAAMFAVAGAALAAAVGLYAFEIAARYVFGAPTTWSGEAVQYCLAVLIFGALPEVTRRASHIAIDILPEALPPRAGALLVRTGDALAAVACAAAGWIAASEAARQLARGLMTNAANPIPRWWLTAVIAAGLLSAAVHLARHAFGGPAAAATGDAP